MESELGVSAESPDAVTWTIRLRPDATFHDVPPVNGRAVEAEDVKATFARALDPATSNPNRGSLNMVEPTYSYIYPREAAAGGYDPSKVVIGSGPFLLESFTPDGMRMAIIPDRSQQLAQFVAGNLDELLLDDPFVYESARQQTPKAANIKADNASSEVLDFQLGDPNSPFLDVRVRRAFSMAIDRDTLGKVIYGGQSAQMLFLPASMGKWARRLFRACLPRSASSRRSSSWTSTRTGSTRAEASGRATTTRTRSRSVTAPRTPTRRGHVHLLRLQEHVEQGPPEGSHR